MNTQPFTKSQIFSLLWLAIVIAFLFTGLRADPKPLPAPVVVFGVGSTIYSLVVLGKKWPWFGLFLAMLFFNLVSGGRGRRRW